MMEAIAKKCKFCGIVEHAGNTRGFNFTRQDHGLSETQCPVCHGDDWAGPVVVEV